MTPVGRKLYEWAGVDLGKWLLEAKRWCAEYRRENVSFLSLNLLGSRFFCSVFFVLLRVEIKS